MDTAKEFHLEYEIEFLILTTCNVREIDRSDAHQDFEIVKRAAERLECWPEVLQMDLSNQNLKKRIFCLRRHLIWKKDQKNVFRIVTVQANACPVKD